MTKARTCASCGVALPTDALGGQCPSCLLQLGMGAGLDESTLSGDDPHRAETSDGQAPVRLFGDYELVEEIARGGMGVVYKARQRSLDRIVAVKLILAGQFASRESVQRFRAEASAAAILQHSNIVAIHEVGVHDGQHFFSMDYVQGRTLADIVRDGSLPAHRAAGYLKAIAEAIQYAHERGILHRDLKPSNVLIDANDQPRITDFGLAKRLQGDSEITFTGQVLGSPNYMPPEQAGIARRVERKLELRVESQPGARTDAALNSQLKRLSTSPPKVGPYSDVYGMGAILYSLLTGRPPFQAETIEELLLQLCEREPIAPRLLNASIPRDLETICLKCLEKEPLRRYPTAKDLANELDRFLRDEPIQARPVGVAGKAWRWCKRKPALAAALGSLAVVFTLGFAVVAWQSTARQRALVETRRTLYAAQMNLVQKAWDDGNINGAQSLLRAWVPRPGEEDLRGFEWRHLWQVCRDESAVTIQDDPPVDVQSVAVSPDGEIIALGGAGTLGRTWRLDTGTLQPPFKKTLDYIRSLVFSPDSSRIIAGSKEGGIKVWHARTGELLATLQSSNHIERVHVSPDGQLVAGAEVATGSVRIFNLQTREQVAVITGPPHDRPAVAFSPDGKMLAITRGDRTVGLWDRSSWGQAQVLTSSDSSLSVYLDFSSDGRLLAAAGADGIVRLWDLPSNGQPALLKGHQTWVSSVAFSPDGHLLASSCIDNTIKLWDVASRSELRTFRGHSRWVNNVVFTPDGSRLVSSSDDQTAKIWSIEDVRETVRLSAQADAMRAKTRPRDPKITPAIFAPDGKHIATSDSRNQIQLWDVASEKLVGTLTGHSSNVNAVTFSPNGHLIASASDDGTLRLWNAREKRELNVFSGHTAPVRTAVFTPDSRLLASAGDDRTVRLWEVASGKPFATFVGHTENVFHLVFIPNGETLLSGGFDGIRAWDIGRKEQVFQLSGAWDYLPAVSPDGTTMVYLPDATPPVLWDLIRRRPRATLPGHDLVHRVAYSPDSSLIATAGQDGTIKLWDAANGNLRHTFTGHGGWVIWVAFDPDGRTLASASNDGTVKLWSLVSLQQVGTVSPVGAWSSVTFSPDGNTLATRGSEDGRIRLWHAATFESANEEMAQTTPKSAAERK